MARPAGPRTRNNGRWTEARFRSFVMSLLRHGTQKWGPIQDCKRRSDTKRGYFRCEECGEEQSKTRKVGRARKPNRYIDHDPPAVPLTGFIDWNHTVDAMLCEMGHLQALCHECHDKKTKEETTIRAQHRRDKKDNDD